MAPNIRTCVAVIIFSICTVYGLPKLSVKESNDTFPFISREEWGALPPTDTRPITQPVPYVVIHHTAVPGACYTTADCSRDMRSMQEYHNSLNWGDIGYNFCVGSEGSAYEGRGWNTVGIHTGRANNFSIGICLIGDWRVELPPRIQLDTTKALIEQGVQQGVLSTTYKLIAHNQVMATECPGQALLDEISTWNHFVAGHFEF